jgi:hypothetical protein
VTQSADAAEIAALREKAPDNKETMEIGRDWDSVWKNQWPQENAVPGFKQTMLNFFQVILVLTVLLRVYADVVNTRHVTVCTLTCFVPSHSAFNWKSGSSTTKWTKSSSTCIRASFPAEVFGAGTTTSGC